MSVKFDQKEDLRLRMADLEKKLAESEEERCKLEKTCNVLMRAFREEEKMHYKALNQKYEKFLEDCTMRKRRNDIILRSLCRIEDRSRALFAKTERLKLLKDRYVSYLNINDYKNGEINSSLRSLPFPSPRYVQWTTPLATHLKTERLRDAVRGVLEGNRTSDVFSGYLRTGKNLDKFEHEKTEEKQRYEGRKASSVEVLNGISETEERVETPREVNMLNPTERDHDSYIRGVNRVPKEIKNDKLPWDQIIQGNHVSGNDEVEMRFREKKVIGYQEPEKVKKALPSERKHDPCEGKIKENAYVEESGKVSTTKQDKSNDAPFPRINYNWSSSPRSTCDEEKQEEDLINQELEIKSDSRPAYQEESILSEGPPENGSSLPKGLDGVDYQNETYPESYYEQPVHHHNHTSIASDVILEEDETEQELDEEQKREDFSPDDSGTLRRDRDTQQKEDSQQSPGHEVVCEPQWKTETNKQKDEPNKGHAVSGQVFHEIRSRGSESEKSLEGKQSDKSEESEKEKSGKNKAGVRSNLIHLLESDSESFQIEHGDGISGNEDSDFDFSFHQN